MPNARDQRRAQPVRCSTRFGDELSTSELAVPSPKRPNRDIDGDVDNKRRCSDFSGSPASTEKSLRRSFFPSILERDVLAFHIPALTEALTERVHVRGGRGSRHTDPAGPSSWYLSATRRAEETYAHGGIQAAQPAITENRTWRPVTPARSRRASLRRALCENRRFPQRCRSVPQRRPRERGRRRQK